MKFWLILWSAVGRGTRINLCYSSAPHIQMSTQKAKPPWQNISEVGKKGLTWWFNTCQKASHSMQGTSPNGNCSIAFQKNKEVIRPRRIFQERSRHLLRCLKEVRPVTGVKVAEETCKLSTGIGKSYSASCRIKSPLLCSIKIRD
jgi:hypothetical protein